MPATKGSAMGITNLIIKEKIALTLDNTSSSNVVPLMTYSPYTKSGYRLVDEYLEINNLEAIAWIYNLQPVEFPVFELEDTESKQLLTAINLEWTSQRFQLDILFRVNNSSIWQKTSSFSLLNQAPYPYRKYSLGNHSLGSNSMIGLQIVDVGFGTLKSTSTGNDKVTVIADLTRQIFLEELIEQSQRVANVITTSSSIVVNSNPDRKNLTFHNRTTSTIYLDTVNTVSIGSYLIKLNPGAYYEVVKPVYTGNYWAITPVGETSLEIREYF